MKKILLSTFIMIPFLAFSQIEEKFGMEKPTNQQLEKYSKIPELEISSTCKASFKDVKAVDNSNTDYFPPILKQTYNSCAFVTAIGTMYTYEMNSMLDRPCNRKQNSFSFLYGYNFLNEGRDKGGFPQDAWDLVNSNGVPYVEDFDIEKDLTQWMHGYDKYYRGMQNRVDDYYMITLDPNGEVEESKMEILKQFLIDRCDGSERGGVIQFAANAHNISQTTLYNGISETGYKSILTQFSSTGMHSMVIVGYDDTVEWDYNRNGTTEEDEKGAFIVVNSWGQYWGDNGRAYVPYKVFRDMKEGEGGTGNRGKKQFVMKPRLLPTQMTFKVKVRHTSRNDIRLRIGISPNADAIRPSKSEDMLIMNNNGGDNPMRGTDDPDNDILEFGVDLTPLLDRISSTDNMALFLDIIDSVKGEEGEGEIIECSMLDYREDAENPKEIMCEVSTCILRDKTVATIIGRIRQDELPKGINSDVTAFWSGYNKTLSLGIGSKTQSHLVIEVLDADGVLVKEMLDEDVSAGTNEREISLSELPIGNYSLRIISDNQFIYKKIEIR